MSNISKKAAEILVESVKDAKNVYQHYSASKDYYIEFNDETLNNVEPFSDTLIGRRQADAIEDYLHDKHPDILEQSKRFCRVPCPYNGRQKRLDRIKWCLEQLTEVEL